MSRLSVPAAVTAALLLLSACSTVQPVQNTAGHVKRDGTSSRSAKRDLDRAAPQSSPSTPPKQPPADGTDDGGSRSQTAAVTTPPPSSVRFSELRQTMTEKDAELAGIALKVSMAKARDNERRGWKNNQTQTSGSITPLRSYTGASGQSCRDYRETLTIGGSTASNDGTACKQPDGSWAASNES